MAVSEVQIAKMALNHIGDRYDIASLSEASTEAEQVNLVFDNLRDGLLREHPWKWALAYSSPAYLSGTVPAGWTYMFTYPSDALKVLRIVNALDPHQDKLPPVPFTIGRNASNNKVVLTDEETPEFEYIKQITDSSQFDANFDLALSWRIAEHVCVPLTGDPSLRASLSSEAKRWVEWAKQEDANEGISREQSRDPDWIRERD